MRGTTDTPNITKIKLRGNPSPGAARMMRTCLFIALGLVAAGGGVFAQSSTIRRVLPPKQGVTFAEPWRPNGSRGDTKIIGNVIDIRMVPVAHVKVQLRSLITGDVDQSVESNANGEYEFAVDNPGTYVVEMVLVDGHVIALSNAGSLGNFETMRTVVQLPGRWDSRVGVMTMPQNMANFAGMSSLASMTAATISLAADQNITPVNSGEPVSPVSPTR